MELFSMSDIIPLIGIPYPPPGRSSYNISCPCCDENPHKKHLNINLQKNVFRCPRCGFSGGVFDLYAQYSGIPRNSVREALVARLGVQGDIPREKAQAISHCLESPLTDIETRHATYTALLRRLSLASDHRENLISRGLTINDIEEAGYKTTPVIGMTTIAKQMLSDGYYLSGVPGFYRRDDQWTFINESRGILIPVRDIDGRIQGLQIRRDNVTRRKYRWVSSVGKPDGCKAEGWVHVVGEPHATVILTEGPLKADIVHALTAQTVVAVAGVNTLSLLGDTLVQLREKGVHRIMTAFDMDFLMNPHVQSGYDNLTELLTSFGFQYGTYLWDPAYKGLDDYVWQYCLHEKHSKA